MQQITRSPEVHHRPVSARLVLEDGSRFDGQALGHPAAARGEVVFTTGMTGYPQYLTDPSFRGQILVSTFPLAGNYGVPPSGTDRFGLPLHFESARIQVAGFIVGECCDSPSHFSSTSGLSDWLEREKVPIISGIDTRALTRVLRNRGTMMGKIIIEDTADVSEAATQHMPVTELSCSGVNLYDPDPGARLPTVALIDCGAKANILRNLLRRNVRVLRVPWNHDPSGVEFDGVFLSNGPGDPKACGRTIATVRKLLKGTRPVFGICLGNQILALASGADTYKLPYGHRGQNQPCVEVGTKRCYITSQNHGYAVRETSIPASWNVWFTNANDGTIEGIKSDCGRFSAVQFHPEGCPGPKDTEFLFDTFIAQLGKEQS